MTASGPEPNCAMDDAMSAIWGRCDIAHLGMTTACGPTVTLIVSCRDVQYAHIPNVIGSA
jgi:hypothetical protein